jgi:stage II sporulation protein AA (anti-sigma F factor antagonist)
VAGADPLEIGIVRRGERTFVVSLAGECDLETSPELARTLESLSGNGPRHVVVDLSALEFIDSSGISVLVSAARTLAGTGGSLTLACASSHVRRVFDIAHVPDVVALADSVEAALAAPGGAAAGG